MIISLPTLKEQIQSIEQSGVPLSAWERQFLDGLKSLSFGSKKQNKVIDRLEQKVREHKAKLGQDNQI